MSLLVTQGLGSAQLMATLGLNILAPVGGGHACVDDIEACGAVLGDTTASGATSDDTATSGATAGDTAAECPQ